MAEQRDSVVGFDALLDVASERIGAETAVLRERNQRLESLLAEKEAVAQGLERAWQSAKRRRKRIDAEIAHLLQSA